MSAPHEWRDTWDERTVAAAANLAGPILIFGSCGFIGANLARSLLKRRSDVFCVTHQPMANWRVFDLPSKHVRVCNLINDAQLSELLSEIEPQTVFNLAAYGAYSHQDDAELIYATNFTATEQLLRRLRQRGVRAYVHAGSSSEYGTTSAGPEEQKTIPQPNSDYAVSKIASSFLINYYGQHRGLSCVNLRLYSIYGPFEDTGRLIPTLIREGEKGRYPPLVDPDVSRDFVYVDDATSAFVVAADQGVHAVPGASLNIASGARTSIREVVQTVRTVMDIAAEPTFQTMTNRSWDLTQWYGDPRRANEIMDWHARVSLEDGLRRTLEWQRSRGSVQVGPLPQRRKLSAVIACYKDAEAIPLMYERLTKTFRAMDVNYEIIFVNDSSPDDSAKILDELTSRDPHVIAVHHTRNFGSQAAFLSGMEISNGDAVILLDGDLQDPPEVIPDLHSTWREGFDVVYAVRAKREATLFMQAASKLFYRFFHRLAYIDIPVDAGDFSLISRPVVEQLIALPERDQFLRGLRAWVGFRQTGIPYVRPERPFGVSTNNLRKNIWWAKKGIFSFSYAPLEMMGYVGVAVTCLSALWAIAISIGKLINPDIPRGFTSINVTVLFLAGVQLLSLSVIGEYIGQIFEEVKGRPKFIRRSVTVGQKVLVSEDEVKKFVTERKHLPQ